MGIISRLNIRRYKTSPIVSFTFKAINSTRYICKTNYFSFFADETPEILATTINQIRNKFGEPLLVNENGIDIPYYVIRATANTGKRVYLVISLYEGLTIMTKNNTELIKAARKKLWDFLNDSSKDYS